jgi:hypothetical protein
VRVVGLGPLADEGTQDDPGEMDGSRREFVRMQPEVGLSFSAALQRENGIINRLRLFDGCLLKNLGLRMVAGRALLLRRQP